MKTSSDNSPRFPYGGGRHVDPVFQADGLTFRGVTVGYPSRPEVVSDFSLSVPGGRRLALLGANGAGKSTLLKAAAGLISPSKGEVLVYGRPTGACHHRVAYLPQGHEFDWRFPMTVSRFVMGGRYVHLGWLSRPRAEDGVVVRQSLRRVGLESAAERPLALLSGGERQRALIARALAQEADLLLLDEPFTAVDSETRGGIAALLAQLSSMGKTIVMATHHLGYLAKDFDSAVDTEGRPVSLNRTPGRIAP